MDLSDREVTRAYEPYRREALYSFITTLLVMLCCTALTIPWGIHNPKLFIIFVVGYLFIQLLAAVFIYRFALFSIIEKRRNAYIKVSIRIIGISDEWIPSGKYESVMPKLYSKGLKVEPQKIKCMDSDMNKLMLRSAMSAKNAQLLVDEIWNEPGKVRTVLYGKYTHIIVKFCDKDDTSFKLNRTI